jgi:Zn-dependent protease with chaperone function
MKFLPKNCYVWLAGALCFLLAGCGNRDAPAVPEGTAQLKQLYDLHMMYVKNNKVPPRELADLNQRTYSELYPMAYQALQQGKYVMVFGVSNRDSSTLLAYPKEALTDGGEVVMSDGTVKNMSADEVKAATNVKQ